MEAVILLNDEELWSDIVMEAVLVILKVALVCFGSVIRGRQKSC